MPGNKWQWGHRAEVQMGREEGKRETEGESAPKAY